MLVGVNFGIARTLWANAKDECSLGEWSMWSACKQRHACEPFCTEQQMNEIRSGGGGDFKYRQFRFRKVLSWASDSQDRNIPKCVNSNGDEEAQFEEIECTHAPSASPTDAPTPQPSVAPTLAPTAKPTVAPTDVPTLSPTWPTPL